MIKGVESITVDATDTSSGIKQSADANGNAEGVLSLKKKQKATSSSIASEFESFTLLRQEKMANNTLFQQEQMATEKQYKVMQLDIEERKFKVEEQKMDMLKQERQKS